MERGEAVLLSYASVFSFLVPAAVSGAAWGAPND